MNYITRKAEQKKLFAEEIRFSIYLDYFLFDSCISEINDQVNYNEKTVNTRFPRSLC